MCKLFISTGKLSKGQTLAALKTANKLFAKSERNGFGFFAADRKGHVARGRYLEPESYTRFDSALLPAFLQGAQAESGKLSDSCDVLVAHGRTSTNIVNLDNVHPFHHEGFDLAHNGVVHWVGATADEPTPVCDSEQLLHWLTANAHDWKAASKVFSGSGAVASYDRRKRVLTIARSVSSLYIAKRKHGAGWLLATNKDHLVKIARDAKIPLATRPLHFPTHVAQFKRGAIVAEFKWTGFGSNYTSAHATLMRQAGNHLTGFQTAYAPVSHGQYRHEFFKDKPASPAIVNPLSPLERALDALKPSLASTQGQGAAAPVASDLDYNGKADALECPVCHAEGDCNCKYDPCYAHDESFHPY